MALLTEAKPTLPSTWYYDPAHYELELNTIWYQDWVCVGRLDEIPNPGDYLSVTIGNQRLVVTRSVNMRFKVFHNTCRHRGSILCNSERGHFRNERIICPYHTWTYSLDGALLATPNRVETDDFDTREYSLYEVHSDTWGGFIFVNMQEEPKNSLSEFLGREAEYLANWPIADMVSVQQDRMAVACNWKIFWENYSECYHCPRVHPELSRIVPVYKKGLLNSGDDKDWRPEYVGDDGRPRVAKGLHTWTRDGKSSLPPIDGVSNDERRAGMTFASFTACMYVVGHPDYVRSVRLLPTGPESVELIVDWLLLPGVAESHASELEHLFELGRLVVEQDGAICEVNQDGLRSLRHEVGVLVPQEHALWEFHEWLRERMPAGAINQ